MAHTDVIVLGAGIVGTSVALHLAKRGLSVALVDRGAPGEETSYGNAGIIEGNTVFPPAFPSDFAALLRIALKRAPEANYHFARFCRSVAPWLLAFRAASPPARLVETARLMRPLVRARRRRARGAAGRGRRRALSQPQDGWLKLYRTDARVRRAQAASSSWPRASALRIVPLDRDAALRARAGARAAFSATPCTGPARRASPIRWR